VPTVLAPALPALLLLAFTVAATADPPRTGPLHLTGVTAVAPAATGVGSAPPGITFAISPR
jgi:hypothetical protein